LKSFDADFDKRIPLTHGLMRAVGRLREFRGKEELYRNQMPDSLETLRQAAVIQSTESSNRIEGVTAPPQRIRDLVENKTTPRDRSEQEIAGYRDVLYLIHSNHAGMTLTSGLVRQLHRELFKFTDVEGGNWKPVGNQITQFKADGSIEVRFDPPAPHLVDGMMQSLHQGLDQVLQAGEVDRLLVTAAYVLDFLCIHPFRDGNGRMARLLTLLLLYQAGYEVGRFVSLETVIENSKQSYYDTLHQSSQGWHDGTHSLVPWTEYLLGTITVAYREFESRVGILTTARGAKTENIVEAINRFTGDFTVAEISQVCPSTSIDMIRHILKQQRDLGNVKCLGKGRAARWRRIR